MQATLNSLDGVPLVAEASGRTPSRLHRPEAAQTTSSAGRRRLVMCQHLTLTSRRRKQPTESAGCSQAVVHIKMAQPDVDASSESACDGQQSNASACGASPASM